MAWCRDYRKELALGAASVVLSLLLAELALRWHYAAAHTGSLDDLNPLAEAPPPGSRAGLGHMIRVSSSPRLVYELIPGLDVDFHGTSVKTNSSGWREAEEVSPHKVPGTLRIVGIGDSVMFGWRVEESERYLDVLEEQLNRADPAHRWEAVALAVPGYNLVMEVEALKRYGLDYSPDLILYGFSNNDFCLPNFVSDRRQIWGLESFIGLYLTRAASKPPSLVRRLDVLLARPSTREGSAPLGPGEFVDTFCSEDNVPTQFQDLVGPSSFSRSLDELIRIGTERGIPVVFLNYEVGLGRRDRGASSEIKETLSAVSERSGLVVVDLAESLGDLLRSGRLTRSEFVVSDTDSHPGPLGHRLIAELLRDRILELELRTDSSGRNESP